MPGTLSITALLNDLDLTRSAVYCLFRNDGGVLAYDRLRRLRQLHRELADQLTRASIADLGAQYGFIDRTHLARFFRTTFGYSMTALYRRMHALDAASDGDTLADRLRGTVQRMAQT